MDIINNDDAGNNFAIVDTRNSKCQVKHLCCLKYTSNFKLSLKWICIKNKIKYFKLTNAVLSCDN